MHTFQETLYGVENRFLTNLEDAPLIVGTLRELDNLIENTNDELNRRLLNASKKKSYKGTT